MPPERDRSPTPPDPALVPGSLPLRAAGALAALRAGELRLTRYAPAIPVSAALLDRLSLGEGGTPLVPVDPGVWAKLEFLSPTGSFKDRGAVVLVASALERGAHELVADSSGNAGSAIAAYAARASLPCHVFTPASTSAGKQAQMRAFGADLRLVPGDRMAAAEAARSYLNDHPAFYASHVYDPYFLQGTKTFAFELWEQLGTAPDRVVLPAGNGTLLLGAAIGFRELLQGGLIDRMPALLAVQTEACAPLAEAWRAGADRPAAVRAQPTLAEGIAIPRPARGAEILAAVKATGGGVIGVSESQIDQARTALAGRGLLVEPTAAAAWAGLMHVLAEDGQARGRTVVALCGSGLKALAG